MGYYIESLIRIRGFPNEMHCFSCMWHLWYSTYLRYCVCTSQGHCQRSCLQHFFEGWQCKYVVVVSPYGSANREQGIANREYMNTNRIYQLLITIINNVFSRVDRNCIWIGNSKQHLCFFLAEHFSKHRHAFSGKVYLCLK